MNLVTNYCNYDFDDFYFNLEYLYYRKIDAQQNI